MTISSFPCSFKKKKKKIILYSCISRKTHLISAGYIIICVFILLIRMKLKLKHSASPWALCVMLNEEVRLRKAMGSELWLSAQRSLPSRPAPPLHRAFSRVWPVLSLTCNGFHCHLSACALPETQHPRTQTSFPHNPSQVHHLCGSPQHRAQWEGDHSFRNGMCAPPQTLRRSTAEVSLCIHSDSWQK